MAPQTPTPIATSATQMLAPQLEPKRTLTLKHAKAAPSSSHPSLLQSTALGGAAAVFAVNFTHPIELVKSRVQLSESGVAAMVSSTYRNEGLTAFWKGLPFAYLREGSNTAIRLGAYAPVRDAIGANAPGAPFYMKFIAGSSPHSTNLFLPFLALSISPFSYSTLTTVRDAIGANAPGAPFYMKFIAGAFTGAVGAMAGNPFDVLKTLAQTNKGPSLPMKELVQSMHIDQGMGGFYRGLGVNMMRACALNSTKMGVYDVTKGYVVNATGWARKDTRTAFSSSFVAGFFMTCTVAPFDRIRTKLMSQPTNARVYNGMADCLVQTVQKEGVLSLWRGFVPIWARFAPMATLQLLTIEFLYDKLGFKSI
eukprot:CAMPEP_0198133690 /NCGR_PEP_ID=MMETSP1442-20131203/59698_1 /TAXON_ID= /ORGANISM="Craspedostauros australis, Strain CCMP3328" /LENGTH=365 /DNA_ID=CAMNT_0043794821 /DNA_START=112 /DNA_END=1208 /DNA_ORIENTATION=-